jgi:D-alanine-D-alanine ligase
MVRTRVAVVFGGASAEREVSRVSARTIVAGLPAGRYDARPIAIDAEGRIRTEADSRRMLEEGLAAAGPGGAGEGPELFREFDVAFPIVHGELGEDGALQGFFEVLGIPYVGPDVAGSALGMNKAAFRARIREAGLPTPRSIAVERAEWTVSAPALLDRIASSLRLPLFVKPSSGGSSLGVTKIKSWDEFGSLDPLGAAFQYGRLALVEEGIDAREIECGVLGNDEPRASGCGEIVPGREFYDYDDKYMESKARLLVPAPLPEETASRVRRLAIAAFRTCGCDGMARVDFFLARSSGEVFVNELNTLPGFTPISMYPKLWEREGVPLPELLDRLVQLGLERRENRRAEARSRPRPKALS